MATVVGICNSVCRDTIGGSASGRLKDTRSSDGSFVTWTACDGDRQMGEVATSTFTTSDVASVATVVGLMAEDGLEGSGGMI